MKKRKHKAEGGGLLPYDLASLAARSHPYLSLLKGQAEGAWGAMGETGRSGTEGMMSALENEYKPEGAAAVNDAGEWLDASGQVLPRQRRPNILPVTRKPSEPDPMTGMPVRGELEPAMPAMADVWNTLGNPFKAGAGVALGSGLTNPFKATAEPFYSALHQAVDNAKIGKGSLEQWLGTLKNTPGVKQEEMDWLGLPQYLQERGGKISKQDLSDWINQNKVELEEVWKEQKEQFRNNPEAAREYLRDIDPSDRNFELSELNHYTDAQLISRANEYWNAIEGELGGEVAKFGEYQLPGGDNYRELLLTMPENKVAKEDPFHSSHWDEPNVLVHTRVNDRNIDGKKTLFIEEIQSDWHQQGRKQGYKSPEANAARQDFADKRRWKRASQSSCKVQRQLQLLTLITTRNA